MKTIAFRSLMLFWVLCPLLVHAIAPVNDKFANASLITGRNTTLKNQNAGAATAEALDPFLGGKPTRTVWYRFIAATSGSARAIIAHPGGGAQMGVFRLGDADGGLGTLQFAGATSAILPGTTTVGFTQIKNQRFYICIEATGLFDLTVQLPGRNNDFFADAEVLPGNLGTEVADNNNCTNDNDFPAVATSTSLGAGIWYKWTPSFTGQATVNTNFSNDFESASHNTRLFVFTGTTLGDLVQVAFDDNSGNGSNSRVAFPTTGATTFFIWVGTTTTTGRIVLEYFQDIGNPGIFEIAAPVTSLSETQGFAARVEVRRHFAGNVAPSVTISSANGTATAGADFTAVGPTVLNFLAAGPGANDNAYVQNVPVGITADTLPEALETFSLGLSAPTLGATLPSGPTAFSISNAPDPVLPGFAQSNYRVKETDGVILLPLQRQGTDGSFLVTVIYGGSADTAVNFLDYDATVTGVALLAGEATQFVSINILNNGRSDGERTFTVNVKSDMPGQSFDGLSSATVTIVDDEPAIPRAGRILAAMGDALFGGMVDVKVAATGALTGKLIMNGFFSVRVGPAGAQRTLTVQLVSAFKNTYVLTLSDNTDDLGLSTSSATVSATIFSALAPCPQAGRYSFGGGSIGSAAELFAGAVKVDTLGNATIAGRIFDGTAFVSVGGVNPAGTMVTGVTLYAGRGRLTTEGALPATVNASTTPCNTRFVRPGRASGSTAKEFQAVNVQAVVRLALYVPPTVGTRILNVWNPAGAGNADLLPSVFIGTVTTQSLLVSTANKVTLALPLTNASLKLTLTPATGVFTGTVILSGSPLPQPIFGMLFQLTSASSGIGFFPVPNVIPAQAGRITLRGP